MGKISDTSLRTDKLLINTLRSPRIAVNESIIEATYL